MSARDRLNGIEAAYWDCTDPDVLEHTDPISAVEAIVESHREADRLTEEVIREMGAITVAAYRVRPYSPGDLRRAAERALDAATHCLDDEEHGHPEGDEPVFTVDAMRKHLPAFEAAVQALAAEAQIWQCEVTHRIELSPDETIEILLTERPEWFGAPPAPAAEVPA